MESYHLQVIHPVEDSKGDFSGFDLPDPMLKESFYDHIQTKRYLLSESKHSISTMRIRKNLHNWGPIVSAISEAVDSVWEHIVSTNALEEHAEESES